MMKLYTIALVTLFIGPVRADGIAPPTMKVQSKAVDNACTTKGLRQLKDSLAELKVESSAEAWKAVYTLLCGAINKRNLQYSAQLMLPEVEVSHALMEDETPVMIESSAIKPNKIFARKYAYGAGFNKQGDILEVLYDPSEVCTARKTLQYKNKKWRLSELMYACE